MDSSYEDSPSGYTQQRSGYSGRDYGREDNRGGYKSTSDRINTLFKETQDLNRRLEQQRAEDTFEEPANMNELKDS